MKLVEAANQKKVKTGALLTNITKRVFNAKNAPPLGTTVNVRTTRAFSKRHSTQRYRQVVSLTGFPSRNLTQKEKASVTRYLTSGVKKARAAITDDHGSRIEKMSLDHGRLVVKGRRDEDWKIAKKTKANRSFVIYYIKPRETDQADMFPAAASIILSLAKSFKMTPREVIDKLMTVTPKKKPIQKKRGAKKKVRRRNRNAILR